MRAQFAKFLVTLAFVALAVPCGWYLWDYYMDTPWTRDARVRADIIQIAPDVAGMVLDVVVVDNQEVKVGDLLFTIDKERYQLALNEANATLASHKAQLAQAQRDLARVSKLSTVSVSVAQQEQYRSAVDVAAAEVQAAEAALNTAKLNLARTEIHAPANGFVTNLQLRRGNYLNAGTAALALVDRDSFYISGYFEETKLPRITIGDSVEVMLMGVTKPLSGKVTGIASGIVDHERSSSPNLLANVNPTFTWVRLAQRIPVRIDFDSVPDGVKLVAGQTATVVVQEPDGK
ncbi:HlyD family secretion protein [Dongia rigui]|uniref:HlyD family secretion protein n=1 Tax=Dongia rigui TaxID=940149 RepID=A0ABU5E423_9PROT|nr:HlyD family secretion protein [Dongia rigui]MDY0874167.1 HlyD family secretion protein [Dongia rigui]